MSFVDILYGKLPVKVQNSLVSLYGAYWKRQRFGRVFRAELLNFRSRNEWTPKDWKSFQEASLRRLLIHASERVPFYREGFKKLGISRSDLDEWTIAKMKYLPVLEKDDLRKFGETSLMADGRRRGNFYSSSGSTGTPTKIFYSTRFHQIWSAAFEVRIREWAGVNCATPRGTIGGRRVVKAGDAKGPFYRYNTAEKQTYFSAYHIGPRTVEDYLRGMTKGKVEYMTGYAMANYFLAHEIEKAGLRAPKMRAVITSSEKLSQEMRDTFRRVYGCATYDSYSGVEACGLISETPDGFLVNSPDVGILEVVDSAGKQVGAGESGELISTGLLNFDQPLIRYRIGDQVTLGGANEGPSNINMPVVAQIDGRVEDRVIGPDGRSMVRFHGIFVDQEGLIASQVVQESHRKIILRLVVDGSFEREKSERVMTKRLRSQLGLELKVGFEYLKDLPLTRSGKIKAVISNVRL